MITDIEKSIWIKVMVNKRRSDINNRNEVHK